MAYLCRRLLKRKDYVGPIFAYGAKAATKVDQR